MPASLHKLFTSPLEDTFLLFRRTLLSSRAYLGPRWAGESQTPWYTHRHQMGHLIASESDNILLSGELAMAFMIPTARNWEYH